MIISVVVKVIPKVMMMMLHEAEWKLEPDSSVVERKRSP